MIGHPRTFFLGLGLGLFAPSCATSRGSMWAFRSPLPPSQRNKSASNLRPASETWLGGVGIASQRSAAQPQAASPASGITFPSGSSSGVWRGSPAAVEQLTASTTPIKDPLVDLGCVPAWGSNDLVHATSDQLLPRLVRAHPGLLRCCQKTAPRSKSVDGTLTGSVGRSVLSAALSWWATELSI